MLPGKIFTAVFNRTSSVCRNFSLILATFLGLLLQFQPIIIGNTVLSKCPPINSQLTKPEALHIRDILKLNDYPSLKNEKFMHFWLTLFYHVQTRGGGVLFYKFQLFNLDCSSKYGIPIRNQEYERILSKKKCNPPVHAP